jgi:hypothetical protein
LRRIFQIVVRRGKLKALRKRGSHAVYTVVCL